MKSLEARGYHPDSMPGLPEVPVTIEFGRFNVVRHRRELLADGRPVELGGRAFDTLMALIDAHGTVLDKDQLMSLVWPDRVVEENNLPAQIAVLRKVFGADRHLIRTVAGRGYQFSGEIHTAAAAAPSPPSRMTNLPQAVSELIGREAELEEVAALVTEHRLVSLVGAGGIGKTRLGLEVARHLLPRFPDGVFVAELGPVSSPELVPPLGVPAEDNRDMEDVFRHGAVRLFVSRAHAAEPRYVAEGRVAAATAAICRRLDGIPLAIELAATRIVGFGVDGVAARLDDRFKLLTGGSRTLARQQTMRATLDWSYDLLSEPERVVLRRLGVFVGPFTLDAASAVAAGVDIPASEVADSVANLVGKSLVSTDVGGAIVYYRLLETTRAYAREKRIGGAEFDHAAQRHAEYLRDLFEHAEAELETRPTAEWLSVYRPHIDDLRAALDWAFSRSGDVGVGVALAAATVPLWTLLSLLTECRARVEQAIAALGRQVPSDPRRDMRLYLALGHVLLQNRQASARPEANAALTKALELAEITNDGRYRLAALHGLYLARFFTGEYRNALNLAEKFRTVAADTAARSDVPIGKLLIGLTLHVLGDQPGARRHLEPLVGSHFVTARPSHISLYQYDQRVILECYYARVLWLQGFGDQARRLTEKLVDYARTNDHRRSFLYTLLLATCPIAVFVGDLTTVEHHVRLAFNLAARHAIEMWNGWAQCFEGVVLIKRGESHAGSQLLQSALERLPAPGFHHHVSLLLPELAAGLGGAGQIAEGLAVVDTALARAEQTEAGWCLAELLHTKGELLLLGREPTAVATAEQCFHQALDVARRQGALSWELRAATSLARLWRGQQRVTQARRLLGPVYRRFTEGFGTVDLVAAKALLTSMR